MSLFFYGAIKLGPDKMLVREALIEIALTLGWNLRLDSLEAEFPNAMTELFNLPAGGSEDFLIFELLGEEDAYDALYGDYGGTLMETHYRKVAHLLDIPNWETLGFGDLEIVDELYRQYPADIPVIRFIRFLFERFPNRDMVFCFDHDFENRFHCVEVVADDQFALQSAWMTIAYGYSWPNLRLKRVSI